MTAGVTLRLTHVSGALSFREIEKDLIAGDSDRLTVHHEHDSRGVDSWAVAAALTRGSGTERERLVGGAAEASDRVLGSKPRAELVWRVVKKPEPELFA